ncbi:hypothetical protein Avbf_08864 [Armadillidium vulgare]|nr:hypothetical protein Avbf_08864 [Armadillidium vulgare]
MSLGVLEAVEEEEVSVAELRRSLWHLKQKLKKQSKILMAWKTKFIEESHLVAKLKAEKHAYLQSIQSQLLIFEGNLKRSKSELESVIQHKDNTIRIQHNRICALSLALLKKQGADELNKILPNLKLPRNIESVSHHNLSSETSYNSKNDEKPLNFSSKSDFESLNDSDSAIMMEDNYDSLIALPSGKGEIKIMRSVSDALEMISRGVTCSLNKQNSLSKSN